MASCFGGRLVRGEANRTTGQSHRIQGCNERTRQEPRRLRARCHGVKTVQCMQTRRQQRSASMSVTEEHLKIDFISRRGIIVCIRSRGLNARTVTEIWPDDFSCKLEHNKNPKGGRQRLRGEMIVTENRTLMQRATIERERVVTRCYRVYRIYYDR